MKKVLLIAYYWPPAGGGGVFRWLKMSRYFPDNNLDLTVYTPSDPEYPALDASLVDEVSDQIKIIKRPIWEPYSLYKKFTGKKKESKVYSGFINDKKSFTQSLSVWIRGNLFIPDAKVFWINPSVKYLNRLIQKESYDVIISTGPPHSMHLIARGLKRKFPKLKWIADFRDPWTNIDFYDQLKLSSRSDRKHKKLEKSVLQEADKVVTVGWTLANELKELGELEAVSIIPNGYDHLEFAEDVKLEESFNIVHLGSMNKDRNPLVLWKTLSKLQSENILPQVQIIGQSDLSINNSIEEFNLSDQVTLQSFIPHDEAIRKMKSAHVLLLVINDTPNAKGILTGKLYEYLGSKRPIIVVGPEDGDVKKLLQEFSHTFYIEYNEVDKCIETIKMLWNRKEDWTIQDTYKYSRKNLAHEYAKLINNLCQ